MHRHPTPSFPLLRSSRSADRADAASPSSTASKRPALTLLAALLPLVLAACANRPVAPADNQDAQAVAQQTVQAVEAAASAVPSPATPVASVATAPEEKLDVLLEDTMNPGQKVDLDAPKTHVDLWARMRAGMAMPELDNDLVRKAEDWYSSRPDYVARMTGRGSLYLYHVVEEVEKRGMPMELALLPFVESAFRNDAQSSAKAVGMWQFMPATGRDFDLKQNIFRDDRRDVLASTKAALDYLQRLNKLFDGDWQLALAAYNWGQGNVSKAVARNQKAGLPIDYESLRMPDETRYYLPKLQAVKNIVMRPSAFGLELPAVANHPYFLSVNIDRDIDVTRAAQLAELDEETFRQFNPSMNKPVILAASSGQLLLPYDNASTFVANLEKHRGPLASWTAWVVPRTMKPADAAKQVGMSETGLREINRIPARMLVTKGSTLLVPRTASRDQDVSEHLADNARIGFAPDVPPMRRVTLKANKGDTVASVARRHRLGTTQLAQWNRVSTKATFKPGQQIVVYVREGQTLASVEPSGASKASAKSGKVTKVASTASGKAKAGAKTRSAKVASGDGKGARTVSTKTALR
ncbi:membrane-bound lytic murein transglycosylase D [Mitsuaria sp. BK045]|uniref:transglycosylase SLT domain-containing protein n=1 Tax=unclassified Roseateles TaxID=2626991 RepID=UPI00161E3A73|nr:MULTISPECIES: transglycosylase SLT domain-containing protein [unclassified Roseateles]MBB3292492.1 membrane-bound lytic murein transglycosylase D [Mitsuaria sp. BK041]MBB3361709.1 membrane-bound lytic murein transglycosylase D [Mitsuaria sp. BK045]